MGEERNDPLNSEINVPSPEFTADPTQGNHQETHQRRLYVDRLLEDRSASERRRNESSIVKVLVLSTSFMLHPLTFCFTSRPMTSMVSYLSAALWWNYGDPKHV